MAVGFDVPLLRYRHNMIVENGDIVKGFAFRESKRTGEVVLDMQYRAVRIGTAVLVRSDKQDVQFLAGAEGPDSFDICDNTIRATVKFVDVEVPTETGGAGPSVEADTELVLAAEIHGIVENSEVVYVVARNRA